MNMVCDNCGRMFTDTAKFRHVFPDIPDLLVRIEPGGTVPCAECPDCGALVYMEQESDKVVVIVRGGVAEVANCPEGVVVEIRDYDTDGCDKDKLEEDGACVAIYEGKNERKELELMKSKRNKRKADASPAKKAQKAGGNTVRPLVCPKCGTSDCMAQIDLIPGYARISGVRKDGALEWAGQTKVDWDMQRPASNPREFVCLACNEKFGGEALGI